MRIADAAAAVGTTPRALRFYEQRGLLPPPRRTGAGQRDYSPDELALLRVIRRLLGLGLTVEDLHGIADSLPMLAAEPAPDCTSPASARPARSGAVATPAGASATLSAAAPAPAGSTAGRCVVDRRIAALDDEIARLTRLRDALKALQRPAGEGESRPPG
ncbi:MerR family transcriptional regulator [Streptomyces sp. NPDC020917]|uniref:MerR family transcriptional regulator n=1 Tax=Streptomyces sp. NPDC020917 TaxID=3365102 RepID=UPI0037A2B0B3